MKSPIYGIKTRTASLYAGTTDRQWKRKPITAPIVELKCQCCGYLFLGPRGTPTCHSFDCTRNRAIRAQKHRVVSGR